MRLEPGTEEYARQYTDWTSRGEQAYWSTRDHLLTLFGGAKGGSKTVTGCRIFATDISNYSGGVFVVMRRNYTVLHTTTKESFERFFPPELILEKTDDVWRCVNDNEIWWHAADRSKDPNYEKTRGLECSALFVDEVSEMDELFYEIAPSLLRRPAVSLDDGSSLPGYVYLTTNPVPGKNWVKRHFIDKATRKRDGRHNFIQSLPDENECLPEGYIDSAFATMADEMLRMLRYGDWDVEASEFVIAPSKSLDTVTVTDRVPVAAGIDIGLGRPDPTVVYCANAAGEMWCETSFEVYDTMEQVLLLDPVCERVNAVGGDVYIDAGSVGKGVCDRLTELYGATIVAVTFSESPEPEAGDSHKSYENRRAQLYSWARTDAKDGLSVEMPDLLAEDLDNTYYLPKDGKIQLEAKANIKARLGRSPDHADAFVLCNAGRRRRVSSLTSELVAARTPRRSRSSRYEGYR